MTTLEQVKAWRLLLGQLSKIPDYNMRIAMKEELRRKALKDWGWVPGEQTNFSVEPELDSWEKEFVEDIRDTVEFGVDVRKEKRTETRTDAIINMADFIRNGGTIQDMPEDIRTPDVVKQFYDELTRQGDELIAQLDNTIKRQKNDYNL